MSKGRGPSTAFSEPNCCRPVDAQGTAASSALPGISRRAATAHGRTIQRQPRRRSWEIDFFGRIRSLKDAALEQYLATEQARRSAQITLVAEVANAYLTLAADREISEAGAGYPEAQEATYELIQRRYEVGASSELDLRQAQTRVDAARVDIARYTGMVAQDENALTLLVGSPVPDGLLPSELDDGYVAARISARTAFRGAAAPPRYPAGREPAQGRQRRHRRGPGGVLSPHFADRDHRHRQRRAVRALQVRLGHLELSRRKS